MDLLLTQYLSELLAVITITVLTIVTPGPDFVIVVRNSLVHSARSGIFTALGVASAVWIHVAYTLAGIGILLSKSILLFSVVKYLGAAYLFYLGYCCIKSKGSDINFSNDKSSHSISNFKSFQMGFLNNALNPKATLFFVSLFTQLVSSTTPLGIQITYGAIVSLACLVWFSGVAVFLNRTYVRKLFLSIQVYIEKVMGAVLLGFGVKVAFASSN